MLNRTESGLVGVVDTSVASLWFRKRQPNAGRYSALVSGLTAWIAATALSVGGFLVTHGRDHLRMQAAVPQLQVLSLLAP